MRLLSLAVLLAMTTVMSAKNITLTVKNPTSTQRQEVVEISAEEVRKQMGIAEGTAIIVKNALGQQVEYQITHDDKLLLFASVRPNGTASFTISEGTPAKMKQWVYMKHHPERVDDIAWENDLTAWRLYGPALEANKETAYGNDVWVKNTPDLVVDERYSTEISNHPAIVKLKEQGKNEEALAMEMATTYHFDHGYGLDCYKVGPSLGCGTPALILNDEMIYPYCYREYDIIDKGPLRATVCLSYEKKKIGNCMMTEHRLLSIDRGSNFCQQTVWYDIEPLAQPIRKIKRDKRFPSVPTKADKLEFSAGVVVHAEDTASIHITKDAVLYADPTDNPAAQNFQIYTAVVFPEGVTKTEFLRNGDLSKGIAGHLVGRKENYTGEAITYYFGSAWSKNDVHNFNEWKLRTAEKVAQVNNPLQVTVK